MLISLFFNNQNTINKRRATTTTATANR